MLDNVIRIISITFCSTYLFTKLSPASSYPCISKSKLRYTFIGLTVVSIVLNMYSKELTYFVPIIILWFATSHFTNQPQQSFIIATISYTLSVGIHFGVSFLSTIGIYLIFPNKDTFPYNLLSILSSLLQIIGAYLLCKIKRLNRGIPLLSQYKLLNIATIICVILSISTIYITENHHTLQLRILGFSSTIISLAYLIYWWKAQITKSYLRSVALREEESKRIADLEREMAYQKLQEEHKRVSTMSHRDNTLLTALANTTCDYLEQEYVDWVADADTRKEMVTNIRKLQASRTNNQIVVNPKEARTFNTDISLLNQILHQIDADALRMNIDFSVHIGTELTEFVPAVLCETDFVHMVDDLLKNALKAAQNSEVRIVHLQFYKSGKHLVVAVADSGIPFEIESLVLLGLEERTTYKDGSGIGLVDIWKAKEKCRATYHIEEYITPAPFTKKISITFDGKNRYSIRSARKDEILAKSNRIDLQVYGYEE